MQNLLKLNIDGEVVFEFDRNTRLPGHQRDFLDKMDEDMDRGIQLADQHIIEPDSLQRARYVAMHLLQAFNENNQPMITATCAYLVQRVPALNTVEIEQVANETHLRLILDQ
ncbi:MAG: hypothetical protein RI563_05410 [Thiohalophilus sp.]|nr:hypothetical protein [Thiohalophilus sp.]